MERIIIAGAATAGLSAARELRRCGFGGSIVMIDQEHHGPYRRPEVSKGILDGHLDADGIRIRWPEDLELERIDGHRIVAAELGRRTVTCQAGSRTVQLPYDGLVIATGSTARRSPLTGPKEGVLSLRSLDDGVRLRQALREARCIVLVGGGFIGLEVAAVARTLGLEVHVVEAAELPLGTVLGRRFAHHLAGLHRDRGVNIHCGVTVTSVDGAGRVEGVTLSDGRRLPADIVVVSVGSTPAVGWLGGSGVDISDGIQCDRTCAMIGQDGVVAAGDIASWYNPLYERRMRVEHWTNAIEQGMYAAQRLLGVHDPQGFASAPYFWSDQYGMRLQSIGSASGHDEAEVLLEDGERLVVAYGAAGRLVCIAGLHSGAMVMSYRSMITQRTSMDDVRAKAGWSAGPAASPLVRDA